MNRDNYHRGFTLIELLVVIVVIAILTTISIVAYTGIQDRAYESVFKTDVGKFRTKYEMLKVDKGEYVHPDAFTSDMGMGAVITKTNYSTAQNNFYICLNATTGAYALSVAVKTGKFIAYSSSAGYTYPSSISADSNCLLTGAARSDPNVYSEAAYNAGSLNKWDGWVN